MKRLMLLLPAGLVATTAWNAFDRSTETVFAQDAKSRSGATAGQTKKEPILRKFMRKKLEASNNVLEGLVTDDLDLVERGAKRMLRMSKAEQWRVSNDPTYARFSKEFQQTVDRLTEKSNKGSVDGAALAWMDVTLSCIECHEWVRNMLITGKSN